MFTSRKGPVSVPSLFFNGILSKQSLARYLSHIVMSNQRVESYIECKRRQLHVIGIMIFRIYCKSSPDIKVALLFATVLRDFTPVNFKQTVRHLTVQNYQLKYQIIVHTLIMAHASNPRRSCKTFKQYFLSFLV